MLAPRSKYGAPPWEVVNDLLSAAGLEFEISYPEDVQLQAFVPVLTKMRSGVVVPFGSLSSGEKIIVSLIKGLFTASDGSEQSLPKVLLLDEVDAPLHPLMARRLLSLVREQLVERLGIVVILSTHSPSTVALSPAESVFVMSPDAAGLTSVSAREAIASLTQGVPTLSVNADERRQVFVESRADAERFEALFRVLRPEMKWLFDLVFFPPGSTTPKSATGTGCAQVLGLVEPGQQRRVRAIFRRHRRSL